MSDPFGLYSRYYDLLYGDKDYAGETEYIRSLIARFSDDANQILELGCGTGKHACLLAQAGFDVTGVERSNEMLSSAKARAADPDQTSPGHVRIVPADARSVRIDRRFDCVLSLFHVVSYQTSNEDVAAMFETAAAHLDPGGVFLFDVWYGPAVLSLSPSVRVKRMENASTEVLRIAEPSVDFQRNVVDVDYTVIITDKTQGRVDKFIETHRMRYFFIPELALFARSAGFEILHSQQWMDSHTPSSSTWGVAFILQKQK
jgi:SAM-dependent methyltransferase